MTNRAAYEANMNRVNRSNGRGAASFATALASIVGIGLTMCLAVAPVAAQVTQCTATYGCEVEIVSLGDDSYVIHATANYPVTWYSKPPSGNATIAVNGGQPDVVAVTWNEKGYPCCCPGEWLGELAAVMGPTRSTRSIVEGDTIEINFGTADYCTAVVPPNVAPGSDEKGGRQR